MNRFLLLLIISVSMLSISSCKKCYTCKPICYECTYASTRYLFCRNDYSSGEAFNEVVNTYRASSYTCVEVDSASTGYDEVCGNSKSVAAANAQERSTDGYRCVISK